MPRWFTVLIFLIAMRGSLVAQQYRFDAYGQSDGLTNLQIYRIVFDKDGFLWVGTLNGVFRFLGSRFEHYGSEEGLKERTVDRIYVDGDGRVWASTAKALYLWQAHRFEPIKTETGPVGTVDQLLSAGKHRLWLLMKRRFMEATFSDKGVLLALKPVFSTAQRAAHPDLDQIVSIEQAQNGTLWMGCGRGICSWNDGRLSFWGIGQGVAADVWRELLIDKVGNVWAKAGQKILQLRVDDPAFQNRSIPMTGSSRYFPFSSMTEDSFGRILVASNAGLRRWDGSSWVIIGPANGLNYTMATSLAKDSNGDIWIGTVRGLLHWVGYEHWESWTEAQGLPSSGIWSLDPTSTGDVLIGTIKGPARLNAKSRRVELLDKRQSWPWSQVSGLGEDKSGSIWMTTFAGSILKSDAKSASIRRVADLASYTNRIWITKDGKAWISSGKGVYLVETAEPSANVTKDVEAGALLDRRSPWTNISTGVNNAVGSQIWAYTQHTAIVRRGGQWQKPKVLGLALNEITIQEVSESPDGHLFVCGMDQANATGVWQLTAAGDDQFRATRLTLPSELRELLPLAILADHRGWLWLGTDNGLAVWNGLQWRIFSKESGLIFNDINRGVLREASDGSIWIGTPAGAAHLMRVESIFDPISLPLKITKNEINGVAVQRPDQSDLAWAHNQIRFQFSSPAAWNRTSLLFYYQILGLATGWTSTQNPEVAFSNLPPGNYRFQVFAQNSSSGSRSRIEEHAFRIRPPWWRTLWFYAACAIASALLIWLVLRLRTKQLQARQLTLERTVQQMWAETHRLAERAQDATLAEERNRLAHELHDSLAAAFTAIFIQLQAATDLAAVGDDRSRTCIARAEELSRNGLQHVREFAQSLISQSDQTAPTVTGLKELVTFATAGTSVVGSFDIQGQERPLKAGCAHALARILQEAVGNAQRYAQSKLISVTLHFDERSVCLSIQDDGIGFHADKLEGGFGLAGMRARAVRLSGTFNVQSSPGFGTKIVVEIPDAYHQAGIA